jgi:DHA2 family multidrug resistance protein-like MFS transporter
VRPAYVVGVGLVLAALGFGVLAQAGVDSLPLIVAGSLVMSLGISPVVTLATDLIVGTASPERAGAASAISETGAELGGALGIAILGSIGTAVYRREVADGVPDDVPPAMAETAGDTLGGAVEVAGQLPDQAGAALLDAAQAAFVRGLQLTAVISTAVMLGTAVLAVLLLRNVAVGTEAGSQPENEAPCPPKHMRVDLQAGD